MGKESRRRTRIAAASPTGTGVQDVPDDLLELVLLRVRTPVCLFRAAATCKAWRRVVAGAGFLRRFRSLHGPRLLLGHYCVNPVKMRDGTLWHKAEFFPSPWRPSVARRRHHRLSLDFLPRPSYGEERFLTDCRGGLLAFVRDNWYVVVCDPWTRQYRELRFPWGDREEDDDTDTGRYRDCSYHCIGAFLLDPSDDDHGSPMWSFRVVCACLVRDYDDETVTAHASVFSARHNRWRRQSTASAAVGDGDWIGPVSPYLLDTYEQIMGRAGGSIFWFGVHGHALVLDESAIKFSTFRLPGAPEDDDMMYSRTYRYRPYQRKNLRVVAAGGGGVRIVCVVDGGELEVFTWARGAGECTVERRVRLCQLGNIEARPDWSWRFMDAATAPAALVLGAFSPRSTSLFSLDVETMKMQRVSKITTLSADRVFPYDRPWPETISAGL